MSTNNLLYSRNDAWPYDATTPAHAHPLGDHCPPPRPLYRALRIVVRSLSGYGCSHIILPLPHSRCTVYGGLACWYQANRAMTLSPAASADYDRRSPRDNAVNRLRYTCEGSASGQLLACADDRTAGREMMRRCQIAP